MSDRLPLLTGDESTKEFESEVDSFLAFAGAGQLGSTDVFIAVMGMTGSGKSTFHIPVCQQDSLNRPWPPLLYTKDFHSYLSIWNDTSSLDRHPRIRRHA